MEIPRTGEVFNFGVLHLEWPTALFIFAVFLVTMFLLNLLLFRPLLATLKAREGALTGSSDRMSEIAKAMAALEEHYKMVLHQSQTANEAAHKEAQATATALAHQISAKAHEDAERRWSEASAALDAEIQAAQQEAKGLAKGLALLIKTKVLAS